MSYTYICVANVVKSHPWSNAIWFKGLVLFFANKLGLMACAPHRDHRYTQVRWLNGFSHGNPISWWSFVWKLFKKKNMMTIEDAWQKDRIFQVFNKTMDIYLSLFSSIISWSSLSLNYKTPKDTTTFLAASRFLALQLHGIQGLVMDGCKLQDLKASRRCLWCPVCPWGGSGTLCPLHETFGVKKPWDLIGPWKGDLEREQSQVIRGRNRSPWVLTTY